MDRNRRAGRAPIATPARVTAVCALATLFLVTTSGCRHRPPSTSADEPPPPLAAEGVLGERALVVHADPASESLARSLARHLSVLPLRIVEPGDVTDPEESEADMSSVEDWQARAWERRIPYILVVGSAPEDDGAGDGVERPGGPAVRLLPARDGGDLLSWRVDVGPSPGAAVVGLRGRIRDDFGLEEVRPDGHPTSWMVCPSEILEGLRISVLLSPRASSLASIREQLDTFPLDPALIELEGAAMLLAGEESEGKKRLRKAQAYHPHGGSELPRLARMAGRAGMDAQQRRLLGWAVEVWPTRLDLALTLAGVLDGGELESEAADVLLASAARVRPLEPDAIDLPEGGVERPPLRVRVGRRADLRYGLGWLLHRTERPTLALEAYSMARRLYEVVDEPENAATCANNSGVILIEMGRPLAAIPSLRKALSARVMAGEDLPAANTLYNLGAAYQELGRHDEALDALARAAAGYGSVGEFQDRYDTLLEMIVIRGEMASPEGVEVAFEEVIGEIGERDDSRALRARALDAVGVARARVDRFDESLAALEEALSVWIELGDRLHEGQTRYNMAIPHLGRGDLAGALAALEQARSIAIELGDTESVVEIDRQMEQVEQMR